MSERDAAGSRRAPLDAWYENAGHGTRRVEDMVLPAAWNESQPRSAAVQLADLSWRRRLGCKGPGAADWLNAQGFAVPAGANSLARGSNGILVARLATSEFLLEAVAGGEVGLIAARSVLESSARPSAVYPVVRQDLVLEITGEGTSSLLRETCNVDFEPLLKPHAQVETVVFTSIIGVGVLAWARYESESAVTLWVDPSFAEYFWTTLLEVAGELKGGVSIVVPGGDSR